MGCSFDSLRNASRLGAVSWKTIAQMAQALNRKGSPHGKPLNVGCVGSIW
jgi:hypothetical protein